MAVILEDDECDSGGILEEEEGRARKRPKLTVAAVRRLPRGVIRQLGDVRRSNVGKECQVELDSHAEQCCVSEQCAHVINVHDIPAVVHGYDNGKGRTLKIVDAVVKYVDPSMGDHYMLVINQAILVPEIQHPLLCTNQLRMNDLRVNDEPKMMVPNPTQYHHAIAVKTPDSNEARDELLIPLFLSGVFSYFPASRPTEQEWLDAAEHSVINLTAAEPVWDPPTLGLEEQEASLVDDDGHVKRDTQYWDQQRVSRMIAAISKEQVLETPAASFADALLSHVLVSATKKTVGSKKISAVSAIKTSKKRWKVGPTALAKRWNIGLATAQRTIDATTQIAVRTVSTPTLSRRFAAADKIMRFRRLPCKMYTDTLFSKTKSWFRKNTCGQVYVTDFGWIGFYPMRAKSEAHETLRVLAHEKGIPITFVLDNAKEQVMGKFRATARSWNCGLRQVDPYAPWQNEAESGIRELKKGAARDMILKQTPKVLWDHCYEWKAKILSHTARGYYKLQSQVPEAYLTGQTPDISPLVEYGWYDWVKFHHHVDKHEVLGRWLGPAPDEVGNAMTSKVIQKNGHIYLTATIRPLRQEEWDSEESRKERAEFTKALNAKLGAPCTEANIIEMEPSAETPSFEPYADDDEGQRWQQLDADDLHRPVEDDATDTNAEDGFTPGVTDEYINCTVDIKHKGELKTGRVRERVRDEDGIPVGTANANPLLDTRSYIVDFPDGEVSEYTANLIAEGMVAQCDADGIDVRLLDEIVGHKKDGNAVSDANRYFYNNGRRYHKKTTAGWHLCVQWKGGTTTWERLADLKESYPVEVAEYAKASGIQGEPAFAWWTEHVLKKRDRIIAKVTKRFHKVTHKFGVELPRSVAHAYELDRQNGNTLWGDAIAMEMKNVKVAFKVLPDEEEIPPGYQQMTCHMIFDVKFGEGFRRKARMVAGGHQVDTPSHLTYATVVSRETVRIALLMAALLDLEVKASDVQNAYLTAPCAEKIWTILGPEFGPDAGKKAIIVRALYGLGSAGASYTSHIGRCMRHLGYTPCKADNDLWMKKDQHPDGGEYYRYILMYVDDILAIGIDAEKEILRLDHYFQMKPGTIGDPDIYLGSKLRKVDLPNGTYAWSLSSSKYVKEAIANVKRALEQDNAIGKALKAKVKTPWPAGYEAELDTSAELNAKDANFYQHLIGVLHWIVELGRVDVITEVSVLASYLACPRDGHMDAALHVYGYLRNKHNARLVLDPNYPEIPEGVFFPRDWDKFYGEVKEALPPDMPEPLGQPVVTRLYVDASHANDKTNRRSRTGFFIFVNGALIQWCSKKQPTVETSVFGAEFVAMKHGIETIRGIRYKLRMMGIKLSGATYVFGDNMSVIHNTQRPESTLKKKSNSICYHAIRESVAMGECLTGHIRSQKNCADLASKLVPSGQLRTSLVGMLLWDICDEDDESEKA